MKKILNIIIGIMLFFPINVLAFDITPSLACDKTSLKIGEQAVCKFKVYVTGGKMSGISAPYTYENEYAIVKVEKEENWEGNANGNSMDFYGYNDYSGNVSIATIIYKVKEDATINNDLTSNLTINVKEIAGENNVANTYDNKTSTVKFNILKKVPTTNKVEAPITTQKPVEATKKPVTTTKKPVVVTKKTTTKTTTSSTTTSTSIEETTTTTTKKIESTKKTTTRYEKPEKKLNVGVIVFLGLFLLLLLLGIILTVREIVKNKEEQY